MTVLALLLVRGCPQPAGMTDPLLPGRGRIPARVLRVADGDTIRVTLAGGEEDVRMIGLDTPETVDPDEPVQCGGPEASAFTHRVLAPGTKVELEPGDEPRDRYGRLLAYDYLRGRLYEAMLARRGLARPLAIAPNDAHAALFERLAARAAARGRGLWGACPGI